VQRRLEGDVAHWPMHLAAQVRSAVSSVTSRSEVDGWRRLLRVSASEFWAPPIVMTPLNRAVEPAIRGASLSRCSDSTALVSANEAAFDAQRAFAVDADEGAGHAISRS